MKNIRLVGYSGCRLEIQEHSDGRLLVVKTSKHAAYNDRLRAQYKKQQEFRHNSFRVPKISSNQENDEGLFQFSMEYINGSKLADHIKNVEIASVKEIAQKFLEIIPRDYEFDPNAHKIFSSKIEKLEKQIDIKSDKVLEAVFNKLKKYNWSYCISGDCHGDLTLENIIWKDGDLYLIDFLDSFYHSWMVDFAKLFQDMECFWSYRYGTIDKNLEIRLLIFKQTLMDTVLALKEGEQILETIYHILLINLLRIMPYAEDTHVQDYLKKEIAKIIKKY